MKLELISKDVYDTLLRVQHEYPNLTFQNEGYEYIDKSKLTPMERKAFDIVDGILRKAILGFKEFNNFIESNRGLQVRFQYDWTADDESNPLPFTGVGYLLIAELFYGFKST